MKRTTYGLGGYDPSKPNNNLQEEVELPTQPWMAIYPGSQHGTVTWRLLGDPEPVLRVTCDRGSVPNDACAIIPISIPPEVASTADVATIVAALGPQLAQVFAAAASMDSGLCPVHDEPTAGNAVDHRLVTLPPGALQAIVQSIMASQAP